MPSDKKRINLTIPDEIYERLQAYKNETGIVNDATACLQLIVQQLNAHANNKAVLHFLQNSTLEQLQQAANEGAAQFQELDAAAAFFCPGHHDFCARSAAAGIAGRLGMRAAFALRIFSGRIIYNFAILENLRSLSGQSPSIC